MKTATKRHERSAFTLVELLIVLAILVMLLALVVPRFLGSQKKADRQAAQAQIELLRGALERYAVDMKDFPTTDQGLQALLSAPSDEEESKAGSWDGPYLNKDELPLDPWGNEYQYAYPAERGSGDLPDIWSFGPDGEDDTEDDICSWGASGGSKSSETDEMGEGRKGRKKDQDIDVDVRVGEGKGKSRSRASGERDAVVREPSAPSRSKSRSEP